MGGSKEYGLWRRSEIDEFKVKGNAKIQGTNITWAAVQNVLDQYVNTGDNLGRYSDASKPEIARLVRDKLEISEGNVRATGRGTLSAVDDKGNILVTFTFVQEPSTDKWHARLPRK